MTRAAILALTVLVAPVLADDLTPPPWRFGAGTTVQHWDFSAGPVAGPPDAGPLFNPYGGPMFFTGGGTGWTPAFNGRTHVWGLRPHGSLNFEVPNTGNTANQKELWLQVTYFGSPNTPAPSHSIVSPLGQFNMLGMQNTPLPGGWVHQLTRWSLPRCPSFERITIFPSFPGTTLAIDQVVIDTRCFVPSPASFSLFAGAGLIALRRRRA